MSDPHIPTPAQAKEVAEAAGALLGKVEGFSEVLQRNAQRDPDGKLGYVGGYNGWLELDRLFKAMCVAAKALKRRLFDAYGNRQTGPQPLWIAMNLADSLCRTLVHRGAQNDSANTVELTHDALPESVFDETEKTIGRLRAAFLDLASPPRGAPAPGQQSDGLQTPATVSSGETPDRILTCQDGRKFCVPSSEPPWTGDPISLVLDIEARTRTRLRAGQNPVWFIRLHEHFVQRRDPAADISFAEYATQRHPDKVGVASESGSIREFCDVADTAYQMDLSAWTYSDGRPTSGKPGPLRNWGDVMRARDRAMATAQRIGQVALLAPKLTAVYKTLKDYCSDVEKGETPELRGKAGLFLTALQELQQYCGLEDGSAGAQAAADRGQPNEAQTQPDPSEPGQSELPVSQARRPSWTQPDVDAAIREYKASRGRSYADMVRAVKCGRKGAKNSARKLFGRNRIAEQLECPKAMVSKSPAWKAIAAELGLSGRTPGVGQGERVGLNIAAEQATVNAHKSAKREQDADEYRDAELKRLEAEQRTDARQYRIRQEP